MKFDNQSNEEMDMLVRVTRKLMIGKGHWVSCAQPGSEESAYYIYL